MGVRRLVLVLRMNCPTCEHEMAEIRDDFWHCSRCGTFAYWERVSGKSIKTVVKPSWMDDFSDDQILYWLSVLEDGGTY